MTLATLEGSAYSRAGVLGNPSDGYFGRTLSVILRNFCATVCLEESSDLRIEPNQSEADAFTDLSHLAQSVSSHGYYSGARLLKAIFKVFHDYCEAREISLPERNFTARYHSSIPRQVGLAGSSAIVTAALRALMSWYEVEIPNEEQPTLILSAELDELGITAGLQDRVAQVYEGLVYMDFSREIMSELGHGDYEILDPSLLPRTFVAFHPNSTKVSGRVLSDVRTRWEAGDREVHEILARIASLATEGRKTLLEGAQGKFSSLMNENFNLRRRIMHVSELDIAMVETARKLGASAKLTGSGGAVIGVVETDKMKALIEERLGALGAQVIEPEFLPPEVLPTVSKNSP